jgi:hypothetical protein
MSYIYLLTPEGITKKTKLAAEFIKRKMAEYESLKKEIDAIQAKLSRQ